MVASRSAKKSAAATGSTSSAPLDDETAPGTMAADPDVASPPLKPAKKLWAKVSTADKLGHQAHRGTFHQATKANSVLHAASAAANLVASLGSSTFAASLLVLAPADDRLFAVSVIAGVLRISALFLFLVSEPSSRSSVRAVLASAGRLVASALVNVAALLPQPLFITLVGGPFSSGEAAKVVSLRLARNLWSATVGATPVPMGMAALFGYYAVKHWKTEAGLSVAYAGGAAAALAAAWVPAEETSAVNAGLGALAAGVCAVAALSALAVLQGKLVGGRPSVPALLSLDGSWARTKTAVGVLQTVGTALGTAALWRVVQSRGHVWGLARLSSVDVTWALSAVPGALLASRQEAALLYTSFSSVQAGLLIVGDLLLSNAAMPPAFGLLGATLVRAALWLADTPPLAGFWYTAAAWGAAWLAALVGAWAGVGPPKLSLHVGAGTTLSLDEGKPLKKGSAGLAVAVPWRPLTKVLGKALKLDELLFYAALLAVAVQLSLRPLPASGNYVLVGLVLASKLFRTASYYALNLPDRALQAALRRVVAAVEVGVGKALVPPAAPPPPAEQPAAA